MGKDLGTYWLRVEFEDGRGYLEKWETGRYCAGGLDKWHPLEATMSEPFWSDESELFLSMKFQYLDGNYSCDCNRASFLVRAYQQDEKDDYPCGDEIILRRLTAVRPDGGEEIIWERPNS